MGTVLRLKPSMILRFKIVLGLVLPSQLVSLYQSGLLVHSRLLCDQVGEMKTNKIRLH